MSFPIALDNCFIVNEIDSQNANNIDNEQYYLFNNQEITPGNELGDIHENECFINNNSSCENPSGLIHRQSCDNFIFLEQSEEDNNFFNQNSNYIDINNNKEFCAAPLSNQHLDDNSLIVNKNMESPEVIIPFTNEVPKDIHQKSVFYEDNNYNNEGLNELPDFRNINKSLGMNISINSFDSSINEKRELTSKNERENKTNVLKVECPLINETTPQGLETPGNNEIKFNGSTPDLIDSSQNLDVKDAPVNKILNSSLSQDTNINGQNQNIANSNSNIIISGELIAQTYFDNHNEKKEINNCSFFYNKKNLEDTKGTQEMKTFGKKTKRRTKYNKKEKNRLQRRFKSDSIRKKIKARMHKKLRETINEKLKKLGSNMFFELLPQSFTTNVNIEDNNKAFKLTMKNLFKETFQIKARDKEKEKIQTNAKVINYLESNPKFNQIISDFLNSTYEEIIRIYIGSKCFEEDIRRLYSEGESEEYIKKYKFIGDHWIEFYKNKGRIL